MAESRIYSTLCCDALLCRGRPQPAWPRQKNMQALSIGRQANRL